MIVDLTNEATSDLSVLFMIAGILMVPIGVVTVLSFQGKGIRIISIRVISIMAILIGVLGFSKVSRSKMR